MENRERNRGGEKKLEEESKGKAHLSIYLLLERRQREERR